MATPDPVESFLDEEFLRKLEQLRILAQRGFRGPFKGEHRAMRSGASLEFMDYRKYQVGDDLRYVDWSVFGRLDKLFLKLFRAEEDIAIHILIDTSLSMGAGSPAKDLYAKKIAAALSYIGLANLDKVGITAFNESLIESKAPQKGRQVYLSILSQLAALRPQGKTDFNSCLSTYAASVRKPGMAVILSDLLDPKGFVEGLMALVYARFDISLIQVLDHEELAPSADGYLKLREIETGETRKLTVDTALLNQYRRKMGEYLKQAGEMCRKNGIDYYLADTQIPFEDFLLDYITKGQFFH